MSRRAGVNVPLFSCRSRRSWGIGEAADLGPLARWLAEAGFNELMLLPLGTMPDGESSPYAATSTLSIDPIYIAPGDLSDFNRAGGEEALSPAARDALAYARRSPVVRHDAVRRAKREALGVAFQRFVADEWEQLTPRAASLAGYVARERWWLDDYALYQAIAHAHAGASWRAWPAPLRDRNPRAIDDIRRQLARDVLEHQYLQWVAEEQWRAARRTAAEQGISIIGDLPFVARTESPEIWARAEEFLLDVRAGVPPDAFSEDGQDWGLPTYNWPVVEAGGYAWMRQRAGRMATLFDGVRVDHVVGLFRTYGRPPEGPPFFSPPDEPAQRAQGERIVRLLGEGGLDLIAEDLGSIPDFVRASLTEYGVPGCRVIRWERDWHLAGRPFLDPPAYPALSAAMTGTHDTEPVAAWWRDLAREDREAFLALPIFGARGIRSPDEPWSDELRDVVLELAYTSGSDRLFLPVQDLFGWSDRINTPGTVAPDNWTWCLPWPVDAPDGEVRDRAAVLAGLSAATGRANPPDYTRAHPEGGGVSA